MSLGLEKALADYIAAQRGYGLYNDPDRTRRVVFLQFQPPVPGQATVPNDGSYETTNPLAVTVFLDGGQAPLRNLLEPHRVTIQCRHPRYELAMTEQRAIHDLLHENGGIGLNPLAQGRFGAVRIAKITADFPPLRLGRDPSTPRDGRALTTQTFTVRALPPIPFA